MKRILLFLLSLAAASVLSLQAGNYKNFKSVAYVTSQEVNRYGTVEGWEAAWKDFSRNLKLDKVYLSTFNNSVPAEDAAIKAAIKFFKSKGVEVSGGITYNTRGTNRQRYESFCFSDPEHRAIIKKVAETTARYFDEIVLDDFYFTNCKCRVCAAARGDRSWGQFRMDLLDEVAKECVVGAAHKVNPKCRVIIKYPNWYDHFHGLGFDLKRGPYTFDGVYTGTETRDATSEQHLQAYESFGIVRYFENIRPGYNFGGWVDTGGATYPDLFAEQLWLTLLAKARECTLFNFSGMSFPFREMNRTWADMGPMLDMKELRAESASRGITNPTWGRIAEYAFDKIDPLLDKLGTPKGIKSYKPFHSDGEEFLHNYLGMIGIPVEIVPEFPADEKAIILTEAAACDPDILKKVESFLDKGGEMLVTSGFYKALQEKGMRRIVEMTVTDRKADIDTVVVPGVFGPGSLQRTGTTVKMPVMTYYTNDSWEDVRVQSYDNGWPLLHYSAYSDGSIFVLAVPDNFSHLYALPAGALNRIRAVVTKDVDFRINGPSQVALFTYDNGTCAVHSFHDKPVEIEIVFKGGGKLRDLMSGEVLDGTPGQDARVYARARGDVATVKVTLPPHSFRAFKVRN